MFNTKPSVAHSNYNITLKADIGATNHNIYPITILLFFKKSNIPNIWFKFICQITQSSVVKKKAYCQYQK